MRRLFFLLAFLLSLVVIAAAQDSSHTAFRIRQGSTLPATCAIGDVFFLNTPTVGSYQCLTTNTWTAFGAGGGSGTVTTVSVVTNAGVSGSVANATTTPAITLSLAQINPLGVEMVGTAGAAHVYFPAQASINVVTSPGFALTSDSTNRPVWATNGKSNVTFDFLGVTGARVVTFPDASITVARTDAAQAFTGVQTMTTPNFVTGFTVGGAATSRKIIVGNGTNFVASTETYAVPGTSGNVLTSDGTNWTSAAPAGAGANTALSNLASVAINTDLLPASTQGLGSASFPFLAAFVGNTTQYESVAQSTGLITHSALGSATNIGFVFTPKGTGGISNPGAGVLSERFGAAAATGSGIGSVAFGPSATATANNDTAVGRGASSTGANTTVLGAQASDGGFQDTIAIGYGAANTTSNQAVFSAQSSNAIFDFSFNRPARTIAYADVLLRGTDGSSTDVAGTSQFYGAGASTGTAASGDTGFKTAPSGATGTTVNTRVDRLRIHAQGTALVDNTATSIFEVALPTLQGAGGVLFVTIRGTDGTDMQEFSQIVQWSAVNKGGSYTTSIAPVPMDLINLVGSKSVSAGTITTTWSILNGTNKVTIQLAADTSLTPSGTNSFVCYWVLINNSQQAIAPD